VPPSPPQPTAKRASVPITNAPGSFRTGMSVCQFSGRYIALIG
jgi:hypothetical protein